MDPVSRLVTLGPALLGVSTVFFTVILITFSCCGIVGYFSLKREIAELKKKRKYCE
jgi:hypothetical protein